jgi:transglutaminase-like putative cysteine protease
MTYAAVEGNGMNRRDLLLQLSAAIPLAIVGTRSRTAWTAEVSSESAWRTFDLTTDVEVASPKGRTQLWLPVPAASRTEYQRRLQLHWDAPGASHASLVTLRGYDVELLHVEWRDEKSVGPVKLVSRVSTRDRRVDVDSPPSGKPVRELSRALETYVRPTRLLPTDGIVQLTAERITHDRSGDVDKARAIYAWVVENTARDPNVVGCGTGDVGLMLTSGHMGGKCADINGLFVALARSVGIPARDAYGVRVADSKLGFKCLGRSGDVSKAQHCRAEFYAQQYGWVPVDPADVRKLMLEETPGGLPATDPKVESARAMLFGGWEMNWVAYNHGHDVALPGAALGPIPFLMYPNGESDGRFLDSLDPKAFRYEIRSSEVT